MSSVLSDFFVFFLHYSQEKEENLVLKVSKDLTAQLEYQGSQDSQGPWATRENKVFPASQENLGPR